MSIPLVLLNVILNIWATVRGIKQIRDLFMLRIVETKK